MLHNVIVEKIKQEYVARKKERKKLKEAKYDCYC